MKTEDLDRLRAALRRGDPADDGREPGASELRLLRERLLESAAETPAARAAGADPAARPGRRWRAALRPAFATAAAAAAALILALGLVLALDPGGGLGRVVDRVRGAAGPEETTAAAGPLGAEPAHRQVQFTTPGGTRIVWVLYPEQPVHP